MTSTDVALPILVDVGGIYDPATGRFDHHQLGFAETFDARHKTKLSSAGLVYKHHGRAVLLKLLPAETLGFAAEAVYRRVYDTFVEALDGADNGIERYPAGIQPAYAVTTDLYSRVRRLNSANVDDAAEQQVQFYKAVDLTGQEFVEAVKHALVVWLPAYAAVERAFFKRLDTHASGEIIKLDKYVEWQEHLFELERQVELKDVQIKYVLFPDALSTEWRLQSVPVYPGSFALRKPLAPDWHALGAPILDTVSGISGCVFVHASGFMGGHTTCEGALEMAVKSLQVKPSTKALRDTYSD